MPTPPEREGALDARAVRRAFGRAAAGYDAAAVLQREVGARMRARLDLVKLVPRRVADLGCGTGEAFAELAARYPGASIVGLDVALPMLAAAGARNAPRGGLARLAGWAARAAGGQAPRVPMLVCGDLARLPFASGSIDLLVSNLALQWVDDPARAFAEFARVLEVGALASFTTFGPDTLRELRGAFDDGRPHVSRFVDMHDLGDALVHAGFADPVMDAETLTLTYGTPRALLADLKAIGATNALAARHRGLTGRTRLARAEAALESLRRDGRIAVTYEVVYGHAWKARPRVAPDGRAIVHFDPKGAR